jgi:hypothetical protein
MYSRKNIWTVTALTALILISVSVYLRFLPAPIDETVTITNFEECRNAGYPIMESYPEQCRTPDGVLFVRDVEPKVEDPSSLAPDTKPNPAPTSIPTSKQNAFDFNMPVTYKVGDIKTYKDGLTVTLKEIKDSRCKEGVQCIWEGELSPIFSATGGAVGATSSLIEFATVHHPYPVILPKYMFTMIGTTDLDTTISIWKSTTTLNKYGATSLPLTSEVRSCTVDADCTIFAPECTIDTFYACELAPINKSFKDELKSQKDAFCTLNPSPVTEGCESVWDEEIDLKCVNKVCQFGS